MRDQHPLSAWAERRPERTEAERAAIADRYAAHLPKPPLIMISDADLDAMKAAFIRRFDEDLPRTETMMAVALIGYRMALRDSDGPRMAETPSARGEAGPARAAEGGIAPEQVP